MKLKINNIISLKRNRESNMKYKPNKESVSKHKVPEWFHDAKLGIFIHWGLYSVPAYAPVGFNYPDDIRKHGIEEYLKNNPYAEWYLNTLRISGSPTQDYHEKIYGEEFSYDDFIPIFNKAIKKWNPEEWAELFKKSGAKYVVLVTKHHDGFCLWPSKYDNPIKRNYCTNRDIVGDLTEAVKNKGLIMGFYYSGGLDWSINPNPIKNGESYASTINKSKEYMEYANNQWYELIDEYKPLILWNDIAYPPNTNINEIFAYFYNKFPEGIVNDRWMQPQKGGTRFHHDYITPEYKTFKKAKKQKWELTRGIGSSFSYNKSEKEDDYLRPEEMIRLFVDVVSKNGNLLLNVGPMADGTIPNIQKKCLLELGKWLNVNGEAIFGTRPWIRAEGITTEGIEVRFTQKPDSLFVFLLDIPKESTITIKSLDLADNAIIKWLGYNEAIKWVKKNEDLTINVPKTLEKSPAYGIRIAPNPSHN